MKKITLIKYIIAVTVLSTVASCKKVLDTQPQNSLELLTTLNTREGLQATLISIYDGMQASNFYGRDLLVVPELLADNGEITSNNTNRFITTATNSPGTHLGALWSICYTNILRANLIIQNIDGSQALPAEKAAWKGEAYFLRALCYFNLVNIFGRNPLFLNNSPSGTFDLAVPIIKDPILDASKIPFPVRDKVADVYNFIIDDLNNANNLLTNGGLNSSPYRPRKVAVQALASRVELYRGNWVQAESWADQALNSGFAPIASAAQYFNVSGSSGSWGNGFPETIFGLSFTTSEPNPGGEGLQYIYYRNLPTIQGYGDITATASLRADLGTTDLRFKNLISSQVKSGQNVFYTMKWPGPLAGRVLGQDDIMILRSSEVLLNRAEARARQAGGTKEPLAIADLNQTRVRAGLTPFPTSGAGAPTGAALISEILKERRLELAFEGHRLWDILRTGRDVIKSPANILFGTSTYNFLIANVPSGELITNPNLVPNPGY